MLVHFENITDFLKWNYYSIMHIFNHNFSQNWKGRIFTTSMKNKYKNTKQFP